MPSLSMFTEQTDNVVGTFSDSIGILFYGIATLKRVWTIHYLCQNEFVYIGSDYNQKQT